jgi:hypothetical protein
MPTVKTLGDILAEREADRRLRVKPIPEDGIIINGLKTVLCRDFLHRPHVCFLRWRLEPHLGKHFTTECESEAHQLIRDAIDLYTLFIAGILLAVYVVTFFFVTLQTVFVANWLVAFFASVVAAFCIADMYSAILLDRLTEWAASSEIPRNVSGTFHFVRLS